MQYRVKTTGCCLVCLIGVSAQVLVNSYSSRVLAIVYGLQPSYRRRIGARSCQFVGILAY